MVINKKLLVILIIQGFTFLYFIQGGGWNQNAIIGEIRSLAEKGHCWIDDKYAKITGDISHHEGRIYSNKIPSVLFTSAPTYFIFYSAAKLLSINTTSIEYQFVATHFITFVSSGIWCLFLSVLMYILMGELYTKIPENHKLFFALITPLSTLLFPYSTMAFAHCFEAFWVLVFIFSFVKYDKALKKRYITLMSLGFVCSSMANNPLVATIIFIVVYFMIKMRFRHLLLFCTMCFIFFVPLLIYNFINFDSLLLTNRNLLDQRFTDNRLIAGVFSRPYLERIPVILFGFGNKTFIPLQTHLLLFIPGLYLILKHKMVDHIYLAKIFNLIVINFFFLSVFNGYGGGVCVGPRYLCGILAPLMLLTYPVYSEIRFLFFLPCFVSACFMFLITAYNPQSNNIRISDFLFEGNLAVNSFPLFPTNDAVDFSFNLGQLMGLTGLWSLLPLLAFHVVLLSVLYHLIKKGPSLQA